MVICVNNSTTNKKKIETMKLSSFEGNEIRELTIVKSIKKYKRKTAKNCSIFFMQKPPRHFHFIWNNEKIEKVFKIEY